MRTLSLFAIGAAALTISVPAAANGSVETAAKRICTVQPNHIPAGKTVILPPVVRCNDDAQPAVVATKKTPVVRPGPRQTIVPGAAH